MGGRSVIIDIERKPHAAPDAIEHLHRLVLGNVYAWMDTNLGASGWRVRRDYYPEAMRYAAQRGLWGPSSERLQRGQLALEYFFTDFTGLENLGSSVMSHWFTIALSLTHERLRPLVDELGLVMRPDVPAPDRLVTDGSSFPLVELGTGETEIYWLEWSDAGRPAEDAPVLFSSERVQRRSLASLDKHDRAKVEERAILGTCGCRPCETLRWWYWTGIDPWGGCYDFGRDEGVALFGKGDLRGARNTFLKGMLRGAPFAIPSFGVWIACTFAREGNLEAAHAWLRHAVDDGFAKLELLRDDPDLAPLRGQELEQLIARGPKRRDLPRGGSPAHITTASELLADPELRRLATAIDEKIGRTGAYPDPLPTEVGALLAALDRRGAKPPIAALLAMCQRVERSNDAAPHSPLALPEEGRRIELRLPAYAGEADAVDVMRVHDASWTLPLRVVVIGDLGAQESPLLLEKRPFLRVDEGSLDRIRATLRTRDLPAVEARWQGIRELCAEVRGMGRDDVVIELLDYPLSDLSSEVFESGDPTDWAIFGHLVTSTAKPEGVPIDACLALWEPEAGDQDLYESLDNIVARGPMQLFGMLPGKETSDARRLVHADPIAAGKAIVRAFARSGLEGKLEGLPDLVATTFALSRVARHLAPHHRATAPPHRSRSELERHLERWLATQVAEEGPLRAARFRLADGAEAGDRSVGFALSAKLHDGASGSVRGVLVLARALDDELRRPAPSKEIIEEAEKTAEGALETLAKSHADHGWSGRTTPPLPDRWPIAPDTKLCTYGFAYKFGSNPSYMIASAPFAVISYGLDHEACEIAMLGQGIEELGAQGVKPIGPGQLEHLKGLPPIGEIFASALERPLDEKALDALAAKYEFFQDCHGLAFRSLEPRHSDFFAWLSARRR